MKNVAITIEVECHDAAETLARLQAAYPETEISTLAKGLHEVMFQEPENIEEFGFCNPNVIEHPDGEIVD